MLDENLLRNPAIALDQTDRAVNTLASTVGETMQLLSQCDPATEKETRILLERVKQYRDQIDNYITKLSANTSDTKDAAFIMLLTNATTAFGEIGMIAESIMAYNLKLSETGSPDTIRDADRTEVQVLGHGRAAVPVAGTDRLPYAPHRQLAGESRARARCDACAGRASHSRYDIAENIQIDGGALSLNVRGRTAYLIKPRK